MDTESIVFAALTVAIVAGSAVLIAGVGFFEDTVMALVAAGGAIMVIGIVALAGYISMLPEPEGHGADAGH